MYYAFTHNTFIVFLAHVRPTLFFGLVLVGWMAGTPSITEGEDVRQCIALSTRCPHNTIMLKLMQVSLALFVPLVIP